MFGLENQKEQKGKPSLKTMSFDLEERLSKPGQLEELKEHVHQHLFELKKRLQEGIEEEAFEETGHLIYGYAALLKVIGRISPKGKK